MGSMCWDKQWMTWCESEGMHGIRLQMWLQDLLRLLIRLRLHMWLQVLLLIRLRLHMWLLLLLLIRQRLLMWLLLLLLTRIRRLLMWLLLLLRRLPTYRRLFSMPTSWHVTQDNGWQLQSEHPVTQPSEPLASAGMIRLLGISASGFDRGTAIGPNLTRFKLIWTCDCYYIPEFGCGLMSYIWKWNCEMYIMWAEVTFSQHDIICSRSEHITSMPHSNLIMLST